MGFRLVDMMKICSVQYELSSLSSWQAYEQKIQSILTKCASQKGDLVLFPEYASMELTSLLPPSKGITEQLTAMQSLLQSYLDFFRTASMQNRLYICSGSFPVKVHDQFRNRSYFFSPSGQFDFQDKIYLTRFEQDAKCIESGDALKVFKTELGDIAIAICYDSEFPLLVRKQVEQGAQILLVPSCTDSSTGYHRVFLSCRARALENQCYTVHSSLIGKIDTCELIDVNFGYAGIFSPVDAGFPHDGILSKGSSQKTEIITADLSTEMMEAVRKNGQVLNHHDWHQCALQEKTLQTSYLI